MRNRRWLVAAVASAGLLTFGAVGAEDGRRTIDVTIKDFAFKVQTGTLQLHEPVRIVLHNTDQVQHGFTSDALDGMDVRVQSNGVVTYGRGIKGLYIDPGNEVELLFTPNKSGPLTFGCDLHPKMKGELVVLTIGAA